MSELPEFGPRELAEPKKVEVHLISHTLQGIGAVLMLVGAVHASKAAFREWHGNRDKAAESARKAGIFFGLGVALVEAPGLIAQAREARRQLLDGGQFVQI